MGTKEEYSVVKNEIISYYRDFKIISPNILSLKNESNSIVLDGDLIECYFDIYNAALCNEILSGGNGYKINDIVEYIDASYHDHSIGDKNSAKFNVTGIDENGAITELDLIEEGRFSKETLSGDLSGGGGSGAKVALIFSKSHSKLNKLFTVLNVEYKEETIVTIQESIIDSLSEGEIITKRYCITSNKKSPDLHLHSPFIVLVDKTPYLNLPLAKDNDIQQLYNQAILTIDDKLKKLSNP
jgi:hypothetical protein